MDKQHRSTGWVIVLGLILGLGYGQPPGWAAAQAGHELKRLFSPAAVSGLFEPAPRRVAALALSFPVQ